ncbi:hypothetical protein [Caldisphaera lagunensis]|uniref:hypothetical protein n=1 Tax=Caldisphaera lagunensis TaxID=200415 RepID=UPI0006625901|nr:hypothetical protein [Caldisphaera lagunensis]
MFSTIILFSILFDYLKKREFAKKEAIFGLSVLSLSVLFLLFSLNLPMLYMQHNQISPIKSSLQSLASTVRIQSLEEPSAAFSKDSILAFLKQLNEQVLLPPLFSFQSSVSIIKTTFLGWAILTLTLLLAPLLFLTLLSWRWSIFLISYVILILFSPYPWYKYPTVFIIQYPSIIIAFVFLGAIEGLSVFNKRKNYSKNEKNVRKKHKGKINLVIFISALIFLTTFSFALFFEPYGPFNYRTSMNFYMQERTNANFTVYNNFVKMISLIPNNTNQLAIQNNMPEFLPRPDGGNLLVQGETPISYVNYIVGDPWSPFWISQVGSNMETTIYNLSQLFYNNDFGLLAEVDGMYILQRGYNGSLKMYIPLKYNFTYKDIYPIYSNYIKNNLINITDYYNQLNKTIQLIFTTGLYGLPPGTYNISYIVYVNDMYRNNITIGVYTITNNSYTYLYEKSYFTDNLQQDKWITLSFEIVVSNFVSPLSFTMLSNNINGTILIKYISINQVSPPTDFLP